MVSPYKFRHGFSKSQSCLHKILQIIASYPSQEIKSPSIPQNIELEEKNPRIDLNTELFPWPENGVESESLSAGDVEKSSSEGECDPNTIQTKESEKPVDGDEGVTHGAAEEEGERRSDCMSILIEAAETVNCESKDKEERSFDEIGNEQSGGGEGGGGTAVAAEEEVVRSKRGRSHVLPSRYRDSVIEPVKRRQPKRG